MRVPAPLSPFVHELDSGGEKCAKDCAACRWARDYERARARKLTKVVVTYDAIADEWEIAARQHAQI